MERPTTEQVRQELTRTEYGRRYRAAMRSTVYTLVVVAAVAILVATLLLPVLRTYGKSMTPTLDDGNIVFSVKASSVERGDIMPNPCPTSWPSAPASRATRSRSISRTNISAWTVCSRIST